MANMQNPLGAMDPSQHVLQDGRQPRKYASRQSRDVPRRSNSKTRLLFPNRVFEHQSANQNYVVLNLKPACHPSGVFISILLLPNGQMGEAWRTCKKIMLFLPTPPISFPFVYSFINSYVSLSLSLALCFSISQFFELSKD